MIKQISLRTSVFDQFGTSTPNKCVDPKIVLNQLQYEFSEMVLASGSLKKKAEINSFFPEQRNLWTVTNDVVAHCSKEGCAFSYISSLVIGFK